MTSYQRKLEEAKAEFEALMKEERKLTVKKYLDHIAPKVPTND